MRVPLADTRIAAGLLPVRVVTLTAPGFVVRVASEPLSIDSDDETLSLDARLVDIEDFTAEVNLFDIERAETTRARVTLTLPDDMDGMTLESTWHHLAASRAEVAQVWPGQRWEDRRIWVGGGTISGLELPGPGEPIRFVAEAIGPVTADVVGDASRLMGPQSVTGYPSAGYTALTGKVWPTVIGRCYGIPAFKLGIIAALNGASANRVMGLAGHAFPNVTGIAFYEDGDPYTPAGGSVASGTDTFSRPITYVVGSSALGDYDYDSSDGAFTFDCPNGGVQAIRGSNTAAVQADGVVEWLLSTSGARVDWRRMRATLDRLKGWEVGVYVDAECDALKILRTRLLPFLPLVEEAGEDGMWLRYCDPFSGPPEIDLIAGQNLVGRIGPWKQITDPDQLANRISISYGYDHFVGDYTKAMVVDKTTDPLCAVSASLYGVRSATAMACNVTWDDATAQRMALLRVRRHALPRFACDYLAESALYGIAEGTIGRLTDTGMTNRRVVVRRVTPGLDPPILTLETVPTIPTTYGA